MGNFLPPKNKRILAVFAHPDDESFGPAGTIAKWSRENEVYLVVATDGRHGLSKEKFGPEKLKEVRRKETLEAARVLGIKKVHFLDFEDGSLCNNLYHKLAKKIDKFVKFYKPEVVLTFDPNGLTGHVDHIVVSLSTSYVFQKNPYPKLLLYYCLSKQTTDLVSDYFIFHPSGYCENEVSYKEKVHDTWNIKLKALNCHASQKKDVENYLKITKKLLKEEWFRLLEKG